MFNLIFKKMLAGQKLLMLLLLLCIFKSVFTRPTRPPPEEDPCRYSLRDKRGRSMFWASTNHDSWACCRCLRSWETVIQNCTKNKPNSTICDKPSVSSGPSNRTDEDVEIQPQEETFSPIWLQLVGYISSIVFLVFFIFFCAYPQQFLNFRYCRCFSTAEQPTVNYKQVDSGDQNTCGVQKPGRDDISLEILSEDDSSGLLESQDEDCL